jgi:hypothetical protein
MIPASAALSFSRNRHLDLLLQDGLKLPNKANVGQSLVHNNSDRFRPPFAALVNGILEHLYSNAVPPNSFPIRTDVFL